MMASLHRRRPSSSSHTNTTTSSNHHRTNTAPTSPTLLRIIPPATTSGTDSPRRRRATTNPSTPSLTPTTATTAFDSSSAATSPSYFSPQPGASGSEARSPATRRPPASFSGHGIDTSRGPPIALITRGSYAADIARRSQKPSDFAYAQQQLLQSGLVSPGTPTSSHTSPSLRPRKATTTAPSGESTPQPHTPQLLSRQNSAQSHPQRDRAMASSIDESSEYDSAAAPSDTPARNHRRTPASTDGEQGEDLFMNIAEDGPRGDGLDGITRDRRRSRIARASNRQSAPPTTGNTASPAQTTNSLTPNASRFQSSIDTKTSAQYRKTSHLPSPSNLLSRTQREQSPLSPSTNLDTPRSRILGLSPQTSFPSAKLREPENSPRLLPQFQRRPSYPDASMLTPPNRGSTYRPSNLNYSSSRDHDETPHIDTPEPSVHDRTYSRGEGTDSIDSTGAPASVWDELDDLKTRIRRIELSGKMPPTAAAAVSNGSGERPQTANTSITTVSTSPQRHRKTSDSPAESTVGSLNSTHVHPLLQDALVKAKRQLDSRVYGFLEVTASEALELARLTGSAGPQGTLYSASSIIAGATISDRQLRRKADNICRGLTELCIALTDAKPSGSSPALTRAAAINSRRASIQVNGDSPSIRGSVEPESNGVPRSSPSRAMSRIEARQARRSSVIGLNGNGREVSQEPPSQSQAGVSNRLNRAETTLLYSRPRHAPSEDEEDDDPTLRAPPSRAMTDFNQIRSNRTSRVSRDYTNTMQELQPSPSLLPTSSVRRPTISEIPRNHTNLLYTNSNRRYVERQNSPALERSGLTSAEISPRNPSVSQYSSLRQPTVISGISRTGSISRRTRGSSVGE